VHWPNRNKEKAKEIQEVLEPIELDVDVIESPTLVEEKEIVRPIIVEDSPIMIDDDDTDETDSVIYSNYCRVAVGEEIKVVETDLSTLQFSCWNNYYSTSRTEAEGKQDNHYLRAVARYDKKRKAKRQLIAQARKRSD
jgi:hypothetical protein